MDIMHQSGQQTAAPAPAQQAGHKPSGRKKFNGRSLRIVTAILLISSALLVGAIALYLGTSSSANQARYVDTGKYQAVFLNGGQVYFGKIRALNSKYVTLDNIYYLRVNQQVQPNQTNSSTAAQDVSLAKLGCELHGPTDVMVINQSQVLFWENLKDDGQVVKAITEYVKANPQGQKCDAAAASSTTPAATTPAATKK